MAAKATQRDPYRQMEEVDEWARTIQRMGKRYGETGKFTSDPIDSKAFDAMNNVTKSAPDTMFKDDRVFTESLYNTQATSEERGGYDRRSYDALREIFKADRKRNPKLKDWGFQRYLKNLKSSYLEEIIMSEDHPINLSGEMRPSYERLLSTVYEGDVDQLKLSAWNVMQEKPTKDRSNIPAGEKY
jgi:hypothetical protein|tara:strand:+ start:307 stop:864 length:558 start_codon:yes stop_codon:yes gene_type:complete